MGTRGISAGIGPFPNCGTLKTFGEINNYLNSFGAWTKNGIDALNKQAKVIPYAAFADLPPLAGPPRLIAVPDDPTYGQVLCFNGVSTSGTDTGWYRLIPAGTAGAPAASFPVGGTTSQVLGKVSGTDYDFAWQTPRYVPAGGTTGQALRKTGTADYAEAWADVHEVIAGGTTGQVLAKTGTADYALAWTSTASIPTFSGALVYSTATQTLTSGADARLTWTSTSYNIGTQFSTGSPSRLSVGSGVSYVELRANVSITDGVLGIAGTRHAEFWKNGSAMGTFAGQVSHYALGTGDVAVLNVSSPVYAVSSGDYFELNVGQSSGTAATISPAGASWFSLRVIQ